MKEKVLDNKKMETTVCEVLLLPSFLLLLF